MLQSCSVVTPQGQVTILLRELRAGNFSAQEELASLVYSELRKIAAYKLRDERPNHTLTPSALANEAWLRLSESKQDFENRAHFLASAAGAMRRILVEYARARNAVKRGGGHVHNIDAIDIAGPESDQQLLAINEALEKLAEKDPRAARIVEMRYFTGLTHSEIAKVLGIDRRTVDREWSVTRAWLFGQVSNS
jgi:RNA polymerase sigma-70 factor (ECF subfamily)